MNKIIILDGAYGVGKTTVANYVCEISEGSYICIDPDEYFNNNLERYFLWGWPIPDNKAILLEIRKEVEKSIKEKNIVIPVTLNATKYKQVWIHSFQGLGELHHIVLLAEREQLLRRISSDTQRDKTLAMERLDDNLSYYQGIIEGSYKIDTSNTDSQIVAKMILGLV